MRRFSVQKTLNAFFTILVLILSVCSLGQELIYLPDELVQTLAKHDSQVLGFSPDGQRLVSGSFDKSLSLWRDSSSPDFSNWRISKRVGEFGEDMLDEESKILKLDIEQDGNQSKIKGLHVMIGSSSEFVCQYSFENEDSGFIVLDCTSSSGENGPLQDIAVAVVKPHLILAVYGIDGDPTTHDNPITYCFYEINNHSFDECGAVHYMIYEPPPQIP